MKCLDIVLIAPNNRRSEGVINCTLKEGKLGLKSEKKEVCSVKWEFHCKILKVTINGTFHHQKILIFRNVWLIVYIFLIVSPFFRCFRFIFVIIFMSKNTYSFINVDWILIILNMLLYGSSLFCKIFINFTNNLTFSMSVMWQTKPWEMENNCFPH